MGASVLQALGDEERLLELRMDEVWQDREALRALDAYLIQRTEPWARKIRLKISVRIVALKKAGASAPTIGMDFTSRYGLVRPNGQWLYRYRLGDAAFGQLEQDVRTAANGNRLGVGVAPALFVLWASEWFRRSYRGDGHRWEALTQALGRTLDQGALRAITAQGLHMWGRPLISGEHGRYFLSTLAREGGFPAAAIEQGSRGWAKDLLEATVAPLLAEPVPTVERATALANLQRGCLPQVFRDDDFLALCADLAIAIVELRREADAPALAAGLPVAAWLSLHRPDWRESLPLTTDDSGARALIESLMKVEAQPIRYGQIGVTRLLRKNENGWAEAARLDLDGMLAGEGAQKLDPDFGRLRAHAAGDLAKVMPGELALIEPPARGDSGWTARALGRSRGTQPIPFATTVMLDLRVGERVVQRIILPGGQPRRGRLLVCTIAAGDEDIPTELKVEGSGSGGYRAEVVVAQVPDNWRVEAVAGEDVAPLGAGVGQTILWRIRGGAYVTNSVGDRYRIRTGQTADRRDRIELYGNPVGWARLSGDVDLFCGAPDVRLSDTGRGGLFLRHIGAHEWVRAPRPLPIGHYEIGWRDDRLLLDRRRIAVLPAHARSRPEGMGKSTRFFLDGWDDVTLTPAEGAPVHRRSDREWVARPVSQPTHRFGAVLAWPDSALDPSLSIELDYPAEAGIARWDGAILPNRARVTLAELRELVAFDRGHMQLFGELFEHGRKQPGKAMTWDFDGEMPMSVPAADIASLLLPAHIDAEVRLGMHDGIETYWYVSQFDARLTIERGGLVASQGIVEPGARLCGRALADPTREVSFTTYSLTDDANHRPVALPNDLAGTWLVYLRQGDAVLSRPVLFEGRAEAGLSGSALSQAMRLPWGPLDPALHAVLDTIEGDEPEGASLIGELNALVASLAGLPPATFRVFVLLADRPAVMTRMAMLATDAERDAVLALSDALPFAWCLLPAACWEGAQRLKLDQSLGLLQSLGAKAMDYAMEMVGAARAAIVAREPLLGPVLQPAAPESDLHSVAQAFVIRAIERMQGEGGQFRAMLGEHLPAYFLRFDRCCLDALDAPCAAALAVAGVWRPELSHIRQIKAIARNFPTYFADAFALSLPEYCHG